MTYQTIHQNLLAKSITDMSQTDSLTTSVTDPNINLY